jgi:hypothetical protein
MMFKMILLPRQLSVTEVPLIYRRSQNLFFQFTITNVTYAQIELDSFLHWYKAIRISRSITLGQPNYVLSGYLLENVDKIGDLGVTLDSKLKFPSHIDSIINKASECSATSGELTKSSSAPIRSVLYNSLVMSHHDYSSVE